MVQTLYHLHQLLIVRQKVLLLIMNTKNKELAYLILRLALGINLFIHGFVRLGSNWSGFQTWITQLFANSMIPSFLVTIAGNLIPPSELILGFLLIIGFRTHLISFLAGFLFLSLMIGMSLLQRWEVVSMHMNYLIFDAILIAFANYNTFSVDKFLTKKET